ncbi:MAG: hypothetical protein KatS3mg103_1410 [Phycisphaerales bacterium]|nr:MAG: hypothetical protein KatS3mg103_1410 [Phycisphaerales bacterium]
MDLNELRVALVEEIEDTIGLTDAHATARARMIAGVLGHVFDAYDQVSIDALVRAGATEARPALEAIEGLPAFVVDRVMLLVLGQASFPVDQRLAELLVRRGVLPKGVDPRQASSRLTRACPAERMRELYLRLEAAASRERVAAGG